MSGDAIKIGIIGAGQNTRKMHLPKLSAIPGVKIHAVANRTLASGEKVAQEFGIPQVKKTWQEIATSGEIDAVVIGTWPHLHCEATCLALESGKHVLCEARMAMNKSEAEQMLRVSKDHPELVAQLVPAPFTFRVDQTITSYIHQNVLGRLFSFQVDYQSASLTPPESPLHWRRNKKYTGMNTMVLGIVYESLLRWLPAAEWVSAVGKVFNDTALNAETGKKETIEVPDYLSVQMQLQNGMLGTFLISETGHCAGTPGVKIFGEQGTLQCEFIPGGKLWIAFREDAQLKEVDIPKESESHWRVEEEFINAIRGKEEVKLTPFATGVEYMKFTEAVILSTQQNGSRIYL
ncbi:MAG: oxidoreductase [Nitrospinaceae bacterium]|nr:MAG: oxidoreductase [Nitrospinaceae bacterium]